MKQGNNGHFKQVLLVQLFRLFNSIKQKNKRLQVNVFFLSIQNWKIIYEEESLKCSTENLCSISIVISFKTCGGEPLMFFVYLRAIDM